MHNASVLEKMSDLFGSYKAEWLRESIFDLYTEPAYFPELTTARPCVLIGGRGTGKTTALRMLSYEGQSALRGENSNPCDWPFIGMYYRVNTNRVAAFSGKRMEEDDWRRLFAHYMNLTLCGMTMRMLKWFRLAAPDSDYLPQALCQDISMSLCIPICDTEAEIDNAINRARYEFESYINNIGNRPQPQLSMQGSPVDLLLESLQLLTCFRGKRFFFLIDEYENFLDDQQRMMNTLIKHAGTYYTFKIGVRELGWRLRVTYNENEVLNSPSDYVRVAISERLDDDMFEAFAREVCNARLRKLREDYPDVISDITEILPGLTDEEEAILLGVQQQVSFFRDELSSIQKYKKVSEDLDDFRLYFAYYWARGQGKPVQKALDELIEKPEAWERRFREYRYASLFGIRPKTTGITKFYCGWNVFVALCGKNVRYLIELIEHSVQLHLQDGNELNKAISYKNQTVAAQNVGRKNLSELEGLSIHGAHLTKLLLGIGRIFGVMATDSAGHAPEVNQFKLNRRLQAGGDHDKQMARIDAVLTSAVMHLALLAFPGNKRKDVGDTRESAYQLHPIFSPYFVYSHKKGRDIVLDFGDISGLIDAPKSTIKKVLMKNNRPDSDEIPEQLRLFGGYYDGQL